MQCVILQNNLFFEACNFQCLRVFSFDESSPSPSVVPTTSGHGNIETPPRTPPRLRTEKGI